MRRVRPLHPACPTDAIVAPYVIDNRRCISYLTIEHRGPIPRELRPLMGDWVFGCDLCQEVCPVNRKAAPSREPDFQKRHDFDAPDLFYLLELDDDDFRARFEGSPIRRARERDSRETPASRSETSATRPPFPPWRTRSKAAGIWSGRMPPGLWEESEPPKREPRSNAR